MLAPMQLKTFLEHLILLSLEKRILLLLGVVITSLLFGQALNSTILAVFKTRTLSSAMP